MNYAMFAIVITLSTLAACGTYFTKPICDCVRQDGTCCNTVPVPELGANQKDAGQ